ncbi:MAG: ABC transporter ATP-binding protein [Deltaproteobacteria bacterium]|nr:ABC transporter ATP-binding protein [Deltaproteobacteria bacterium]
MATAQFARVSKHYGAVVGLDDFSLRVGDGELVAILGPSGCGKSTLLRLTAGLEAPSGGEIRIGERRIDALPAHRRDVAMVFQSYALYPHLSVRGNIEFPLRRQGLGATERGARLTQIAAALDLAPLLDRRPAALSGGQRQRVALARALVRQPKLFLLDEPLSNLDARLRLGVRQYLRALQRRLHVTTLYVTHDQTEAMTLGDRIVVMHGGRIQQVDTPDAVYQHPANAFVAGFVGTPPMNLLPAELDDDGLTIGSARISLPAALRPAAHGRLQIGIRPEAFGASERGALPVLTDPTTIEILGSETLARATLGGLPVTVRLPGIVRDPPPRLSAALAALHFFAADASGARLA